MVIIPVQSFRKLDPIRQQMEQMLDNLLRSDRYFTQLPSNNITAWAPAITIQETEAAIILKVEVPVVDARDLTVEVSQEGVLITGDYSDEERTEEQARLFLSRFRCEQYQRFVALPALVYNNQVKADFKEGILTLTMPKVEEISRKAVKVNQAAQNTFPP